MTVKPKYYFNLDGNISDGEKEYSLENIEDKIGGLSISSDLKDNYVLYGRNSLLALINNFNDENEQLKNEVFDWKRSAEDYFKIGKSLKKENEQLKKEIIVIEKRADKVYDENEQLKSKINFLECGMYEKKEGDVE